MNDICARCPKIAEYECAGQNLCSACVSIVAATLPVPAHVPPKKRKRTKGKNIDEIDTKKHYSGEASPYWEHLTNQGWQNDKGQLLEEPLANPDVLSEEASPYFRPKTEEQELYSEILQDVIATLTPLQQQALTLCEAEDYTEDKAALSLGITRRAFRTIVARIRKTIERKYIQRKKSAQYQK